MGLIELETFLTVVKCGGFGAAALELHISQPSVTNRINRLESLLRTRLLHRTTRRIEMSDAGRDLYACAESSIQELRSLVSRLMAESDRNRTRISVATTPTLAAMAMPRLLKLFTAEQPGIEVDVLDLRPDEVLDALRTGRADLALTAETPARPGFEFCPIADTPVVLIVPPGHPLLALAAPSFRDVMDYPILSFDSAAGTGTASALSAEFQRRGRSFTPLHAYRNIATLLGMVAGGIGVAFVPHYVTEAEQARAFRTIPLPDFAPERRYGVLCLKDQEKTAAAWQFERFARRHFPGDRKAPAGHADCA